jgi:hypothetical protein
MMMPSNEPRLRAMMYALQAAGLFRVIAPGTKAVAHAAVATLDLHHAKPGSKEYAAKMQQLLAAMEGNLKLAQLQLSGDGGMIEVGVWCLRTAYAALTDDAEVAATQSMHAWTQAKGMAERVTNRSFDLGAIDTFIMAWVERHGPEAVDGVPLPDSQHDPTEGVPATDGGGGPVLQAV